MKILFIAIIRLYKYMISPLFPSTCRFTPSCSEYAIDALNKYGTLKGLALAVRRILRCNPFHEGGFDPVK
ncbi:MAG: membrane protein insertion efficiency factor YidD [Nitrospirae bacterium]|nr:membrane protein insertion efficiency factor YidD [Nitrospirota bacterium]